VTKVGRAFAIANVVMFFLFLVCVALQYNDPDPYFWMPMYGAAALACWLFWKSRPHRLVCVLVGIVALVWALTIAPHVVGKVRFMDMFAAWKAMTPESEEAREMGGLLIVSGWMIVIGIGGGITKGRTALKRES
jgi:hypothetical protein